MPNFKTVSRKDIQHPDPTLKKENKKPNLTMIVFRAKNKTTEKRSCPLSLNLGSYGLLSSETLFFKKKRKLFPSLKMTFQSSF